MELFRKHTLFSIYLVVFFVICYGVIVTSGFDYFGYLSLYFFALVISYMFFNHKKVKHFLGDFVGKLNKFDFNLNILLLVIPSAFFIAAHFIYLGGSPSIEALSLNYIEEVALLRYKITEGTPSWLAYGCAITLKATLPFLLLYFLYFKKHIFYWIVLIVGSFYSFSLMQKSYIVGLLIPVFIYCLSERKFLYVLKYVGLILAVIFGLSYIANPTGGSNPKSIIAQKSDTIPAVQVDNEPNGITGATGCLEVEPITVVAVSSDTSAVVINPPSEHSKLFLVAYGLYHRLAIIPGQVVTGWFQAIPCSKPFLNGAGYRIWAKLRGVDYHDYSTELYPVLQPGFSAQGLTGTVNVASFMYEYSNFGWIGLVLSGFILAFLFLVFEILFAGNFKLKLSINTYPVLLLSSGAITTLMFSNGWGFIILFYFLFFKNKVR
jgi:hypothetical protein